MSLQYLNYWVIFFSGNIWTKQDTWLEKNLLEIYTQSCFITGQGEI